MTVADHPAPNPAPNPTPMPTIHRPLATLALSLAALLPLLAACTGGAGSHAAPKADGSVALGVAPLARATTIARAGDAPAADGAEALAPPVRSLDREWLDATRDRIVPVRLYLPDTDADATASSARLSLVVFSHGLGGSRTGYSHLGRHWAARGIASLHLQHAGSDRAVWTDGGALGLPERLRSAASTANAVARALDVSFALDRLLDDPVLAARIDPARIAVAGHSYGANTALLVAGARFDQDDGPATLRDPRVRAAVLMSAPPFPARFDPREVLSGVAIPTLHLTTVDDVIRVPGFRSVAQDRIALYEAMAAAPKWLAVFASGAHDVFTDRGTDPPSQAVKRATRDLSTGFLRTVLNARSGTLERAFEEHASLLAAPSSTAQGSARLRPPD